MFKPGTFKTTELIRLGVLQIGDGYRAKNSELSTVGIPFARAGNINNGFLFENADFFPIDDLGKVGDKKSKNFDSVFTSKGTVGRIAYVKEDTPEFVYSPQLCYWRSLDFEAIDPRFLNYWMNGVEFTNQVDYLKGQTDMADYVSLRDQRKMTISVPDIELQRKIADILGHLDDKIELNRQTNQTLEQIAQTIFKSWFVDFDPVKAKIEAKAAGRDPERAAMCAISGAVHGCTNVAGATKSEAVFDQLSAEQRKQLAATAALFPDELVESELGLIPKGWEVKPVSDWGQVVCGKTPPKKKAEYYDGDIPFIKIPDMHGNMFATRTSDSLSCLGGMSQIKKQIPKGSVCVSCIATVGQVVIATKDSHTNQQINSIVPRKQIYTPYMYFAMSELTSHLHDLASGGSATLNLNTGNFSKINIVAPSEEILSAYASQVDSIFDRVLNGVLEQQSLTEVRDTLLPRLLSGELTVCDEIRFEETAYE